MVRVPSPVSMSTVTSGLGPVQAAISKTSKELYSVANRPGSGSTASTL